MNTKPQSKAPKSKSTSPAKVSKSPARKRTVPVVKNSNHTEPKAAPSKLNRAKATVGKEAVSQSAGEKPSSPKPPAHPATTAPPSKAALVVADHEADRGASKSPAALAKTDRAVLDEAVRRATQVVRGAESLLVDYGEWLFATLFGGDTARVLDQELSSPVWASLLRHSDTGRIELARSTLSGIVRVAAYTKRLDDSAWNALSYTQKYTLLALADPKAMRAAARHVLSASCTVKQTREYVQNITHPDGPAPARLSPAGAQKTVGSLRAKFATPTYVRKLESALGKLAPAQRAEAKSHLHEVIAQLQRLVRVLGKV